MTIKLVKTLFHLVVYDLKPDKQTDKKIVLYYDKVCPNSCIKHNNSGFA